MKKIALNIDQMKHLESLGLDISNASMGWYGNDLTVLSLEEYLKLYDTNEYGSYIPAYTLQDILDKLPPYINYLYNDEYHKGDVETSYLKIEPGFKTKWRVSYYAPIHEYGAPDFNSDCLLDAVYQQLIWCIKNNYIKIKNELSEETV